MHSRLLRCFLVVAEKKSITEASEALHISQPALTKSIKHLEEDLGVQLFERLPIGVRLTNFGEILHHHAKVMDNEYRHAISRIDELKHGRAGALRIGAGPVWLVNILPPIISQFQAQFPDVKISLIGGVIDTLLPALANGELDLICASLDFPNRSEVVKEQLFDVRHVLVANKAHPLADLDDIGAEELHHYPWMVLKSDYVGTERISSYFAANGLRPPEIALDTTSINSLLQSLKGCQAIAHIPEQMLPIAMSNDLEQIKVKQVIWETTAGYAYRASARRTGPLDAFIKTLEQLRQN